MRKAIMTVAFLSASACTSIEATRPDMESRPVPSRADEVAYINALRKAYAVEPAGGASVPCYTGEKLKPFRPKYVQGYPDWDPEQEAVGAQGTCLGFAKNPGDAAITSYLESGFGLTDLYCQRYFTIATETRQSRRLQRGLFKTGDGLFNAVMAALNIGANPIAISSAGFSAIDSGYGEIDDAFVVAPSRDDVRKLVLSAQQRFRSDMFTKGKDGQPALPKSYASARSAIERYAGLCTFDGMRQLVADAVASKTDALNQTAGQQAAADSGEGNGQGHPPKPPAGTPATPPKPPTDAEGLVAPPPISPR